jgi:hypothetical protein
LGEEELKNLDIEVKKALKVVPRKPKKPKKALPIHDVGKATLESIQNQVLQHFYLCISPGVKNFIANLDRDPEGGPFFFISALKQRYVGSSFGRFGGPRQEC